MRRISGVAGVPWCGKREAEILHDHEFVDQMCLAWPPPSRGETNIRMHLILANLFERCILGQPLPTRAPLEVPYISEW